MKPPTMRAKVVVDNIVTRRDQNQVQETLQMRPVCGGGFDEKGNCEDNTFARWTPSGSIELSVTNPALHGRFVPGQKFYVDFTPADELVGGEQA